MPKSYSFPIWLEGTPQQKAAEEERQVIAMASHGRGHLTEAERLVGRGRLLEETAKANLEQSFGVKGKEDERVLAKSQLAEAMAMQGRYAEAADVHPDVDRRADFRKIAVAIELDDEEKCGCPDNFAEYHMEDGRQKVHKPKSDKAEKGGEVVSLTPRFERAKVFSPIHGDVVSLVECSRCGHLNGRPLRSRLLKNNAAIDANEAVARSDVKRKVFVRDAGVLA